MLTVNLGALGALDEKKKKHSYNPVPGVNKNVADTNLTAAVIPDVSALRQTAAHNMLEL